jgi:diguanylate cyclase (GGDEF)-like protein
MRARLLRADAEIREGNTGAGGRLAQEVNAWAAKRADDYVLACSHRVLCQFRSNVGDDAAAVMHALESVAHLPPDAPLYARARHLNVLGVVLSFNDQPADAIRRFEEALDISLELGDDAQALMILSNLADTRAMHDDLPGAVETVRRLEEHSRGSGMPLDMTQLNVIAVVQLENGDYDGVEATLRPLTLDPEYQHSTSGSLADALVVLADAHREAGRYAAAQRDIDEAGRLSAERSLGTTAADVLEQQAKLYAAQERYQEAYETFRRFHAAATKLQSARRDAQARALQALFETQEAKQDSERFREMAHRDPLTGLHNRRFVNERLPVLLAGPNQLAVAIVDLDHFKRINDTLSHDAGDLVLQHIAVLLTEATPEPDLAARLGGEEFLLIFPDTGADDAVRRCERLAARIRGYDWTPVTGALPVTASIGVAATGGTLVTQPVLLAEADAQLYAAKRAGRDRVSGAATGGGGHRPGSR